MKKGLNQVQKSLLIVIGILAIILASALIFKGYGFYQEKKQEKEWAARNQEVQQEIDSVRVQIEELAGDAEALQIFLNEQVNSVVVLDEWQSGEREVTEGQDSVNGEGAQGTERQENAGEAENQGNGQAAGNQRNDGETAEQGDEGIPDAGSDTALEVPSEAIVIDDQQVPQEDETGQKEDISQPTEDGQAGTDGETSETQVDKRGLEAAVEGAIIIDAPPAPKPPAEGSGSGGKTTVSGNGSDRIEKEDTVSENGAVTVNEDDTVSGNGAAIEKEEEDTVSGNGVAIEKEEEDTVSGNGVIAEEEEDTVSGNGAAIEKEEEDTVSGNGVIAEEEEDTVSGNGVVTEEEEDTVSSNAAGSAEWEDSVSGNAAVDGQVIPYVSKEPEITLEERRKIRSSFLETTQTNSADKAVITDNGYDFSDVKIACLGDSLTAGSNLDHMEDYQQYSYPSVLKNILQAEEVYNLGIGGSSYGRYWDNAFVDRYQEIPKDVDIILVMGGANDGFAASEKELGSLEEKKARTFYGDVDELMRGLKRDYPDAKIIFATPLPNVLHDYLRVQRDYLLPQSVYANAIKELAAQYQINVIDLYNSNLLDTHDAQVISNYMPDGVHGNPAGYQVLAEHMASSIIEIVQREGLGNAQEQGTVSGNSADGFSDLTVSGNSAEGTEEDTASGNGINNSSPALPERVLSPEDAKRLEEERLRAEQERLEREKEEAAKAEENNKKVAEDAVIITPAQEPAGAIPAGENQEDADQAETMQGVQDGAAPDSAPEAGTSQKGDYEYGGEAIIIQ